MPVVICFYIMSSIMHTDSFYKLIIHKGFLINTTGELARNPPIC